MHRAAHQVGEKDLVGLGHGSVVKIPIEAVIGELADHRLDTGAGDFHLIEGLHGGQTGHAPRQSRLWRHRAAPSR